MLADEGVGRGVVELAAFPEPDDGDAQLVEPVLAEGLAREGCACGVRLGEEELVEPPDDVGDGVSPDHAAGEGAPEHRCPS